MVNIGKIKYILQNVYFSPTPLVQYFSYYFVTKIMIIAVVLNY